MEQLDQILADVEEIDAPDDDKFVIDNDGAAGWAIRKIKQAQDNHAAFAAECAKRRDRLTEAINQIDARLKQSENEMQSSQYYLQSLLEQYFDTLPDNRIKKTKTQRQYLLPEGKLVRKSQAPQYLHDDEKLLGWLKENNETDLIKVEERPRWADVKARLVTKDNKAYYADTGEEVPGVSIVERPDVFEIKI